MQQLLSIMDNAKGAGRMGSGGTYLVDMVVKLDTNVDRIVVVVVVVVVRSVTSAKRNSLALYQFNWPRLERKHEKGRRARILYKRSNPQHRSTPAWYPPTISNSRQIASVCPNNTKVGPNLECRQLNCLHRS